MKKLIALMGILSLTTGLSFAYINESKTSDVEVLKSQGFSDSALKIVDLVNTQQAGLDGKYVKYYQPKKHKGLGKPYTRLKNYIDPVQDDGMFGEHQIHYSNSWRPMEEEPQYIKKSQPSTGIENL